MPLVIVMVAAPLPLPEHPPVVVIATARPELDVAATPNDEPYSAEAGAGVVTVMAWVALSASVQAEKLVTPLSSIQVCTGGRSTLPVQPWGAQVPLAFQSWRLPAVRPFNSPVR